MIAYPWVVWLCLQASAVSTTSFGSIKSGVGPSVEITDGFAQSARCDPSGEGIVDFGMIYEWLRPAHDDAHAFEQQLRLMKPGAR